MDLLDRFAGIMPFIDIFAPDFIHNALEPITNGRDFVDNVVSNATKNDFGKNILLNGLKMY